MRAEIPATFLLLANLVGCKSTSETASRAEPTPSSTAMPSASAPSETASAAPPLIPAAPPAASSGPLERSPFAKRAPAGSTRDVEVFNSWATSANLRDDLPRLVVSGLPLSPDVATTIDVRYDKGESPNGAVVTVTQDGFLDDSVRGERFVLRFSRKACTTCPTGKSGWWLYSLDVTRRCWEGRGSQEFSADSCS